ncbi:hypothetical protein MMPV_006097 [Pyropia vietnamensis]
MGAPPEAAAFASPLSTLPGASVAAAAVTTAPRFPATAVPRWARRGGSVVPRRRRSGTIMVPSPQVTGSTPLVAVGSGGTDGGVVGSDGVDRSGGGSGSNSDSVGGTSTAGGLLRPPPPLGPPPPGGPPRDPFWASMQAEARAAATEEPLLASFLYATVLNHPTLTDALSFHLANKLASTDMPATLLQTLFRRTLAGAPDACATLRADLVAVATRDPACDATIEALLYFKGFHALQVYRIAHMLYKAERREMAYFLQSLASRVLHVDIHPGAVIGPGAFLDHATGVVVGETAVLGEGVSLLHAVTLGGTGKAHGVRHPQVGDGVVIGAGATLLGGIHVGGGASIGACSLVLEDIPAGAVAVGVPARVVALRKPKVVAAAATSAADTAAGSPPPSPPPPSPVGGTATATGNAYEGGDGM